MLPALFFGSIYLGLWLVVRNFGPPVIRQIRRWVSRAADLFATLVDHRPAGAGFLRRQGSWRRWVPVAVILALGVGLSTIFLDLFIDIAERLEQETSVIDRIDRLVHQQTRLWMSADATLFFRFVTELANPFLLVAVVLVGGGWLWWRRYRVWSVYLVFTCAVGGLLNYALKLYFQRARPELAGVLKEATGYAFPSGHSMGSMVVYGAICWASVRILPSWRKDSTAIAFLCTLVLAIGLSRIYLGVHWFSDVVGGFAAGLGWVVTSTAGFEAWLQVRRGGTVTELLQTSDRGVE